MEYHHNKQKISLFKDKRNMSLLLLPLKKKKKKCYIHFQKNTKYSHGAEPMVKNLF